MKKQGRNCWGCGEYVYTHKVIPVCKKCKKETKEWDKYYKKHGRKNN